MPVKRQSPYIWVTWLTRLLVGEECCEWAAWFKAHHEGDSYKKMPNSLDLPTWQIDHTNLVREIRVGLEAEGQTVFQEGQNSFVLRGNSASLGGKPDIIAISGTKGLIIDAKTGKHSPAHHIQVMVYMYAVPRVLRQFKGIEFNGRVVYKDKIISIPASSIDKKFIENLSAQIVRLSSTKPPPRIANPVECGFCEITKADCPERVESETTQQGITSDF